MRVSWRTAAVLGISGALLSLGVAITWQTERALRGADRSIAAQEDLGFTKQVLAPRPNPGFSALSTPAVFRSAALFEGRVYMSGPGGLFVYSRDGALLHIYRPGTDLPAAPLGQLATATIADGSGPELLIPTRGEGVLAFDGNHFRQIRPATPETRDVTALLPLASGRLLLGTSHSGLLVFDGKTLRRFHSTTNGLYVTALAGTESDLWIGTLNRGLVHWRGGQSQTIAEADGLPDVRVESIAMDGSTVYVGTPIGVAELRDGRVTRILARGFYAHAVLPRRGALFVGQLQGGILTVSTAANEARPTFRRAISAPAEPESQPTSEAPVEQFFAAGNSYYAVTGDQLLQLEPGGEWREVLRAGGALLTDGNVSALLIGSDGRIWVGYFDRGLDILSSAGARPRHIEDDHVFCVNRILEDPQQGSVAVATANGLVLFGRDGREKQVLTRDSGLIASHVTDVALFGDGMVAATPAGITFLDASGPHSLYAFQGLVNNHVYALGVGKQHLIVGTLGGISLISGGQIRDNLNTGNSGLKANWITALAPAGPDWLVGTYGAGLLRLSPDGTVTTTDATVAGTVINPGAMASDGQLVLAGTLSKGLLVGDAAGAHWKTITAGLPSRNVTALAIHGGTVYIGTDNGLVEIAEDKL